MDPFLTERVKLERAKYRLHVKIYPSRSTFYPNRSIFYLFAGLSLTADSRQN